jgi:hypothetical protein
MLAMIALAGGGRSSTIVDILKISISRLVSYLGIMSENLLNQQSYNNESNLLQMHD